MFLGISCSEKSNHELRFAFIGDLHYLIPEFATAEYLVPPVSDELHGLKPRPEFIIHTGDFFHGGSTTSYHIITVKDKEVQVDWRVLGHGVIRSFRWDKPGRIIDLIVPAQAEKRSFTDDNLPQIEKAWYYAALWTMEDSVTVPLLINGVPAGTLAMSRKKMSSSPFWNKVEIPLNRSSIDVLRQENEISIMNPSKSDFGLAHMFLLVQFKDGRFSKSGIVPKVLTSFPPEEKIENFPASELIDSVTRGEPLAKVKLRLDNFYVNLQTNES